MLVVYDKYVRVAKETEVNCVSFLTYASQTKEWLTKWCRNRWDYWIDLTFTGPCIANVFSSATNKMQRYTIYLFLSNALHVSGGSSAHHQELNTVYTALSTLSNLFCYLPQSCSNSSTIAAGSGEGLTKCPMLYIQLWAPDDGRRNRLKHVEHITKNK